jgi:hypothetical protein
VIAEEHAPSQSRLLTCSRPRFLAHAVTAAPYRPDDQVIHSSVSKLPTDIGHAGVVFNDDDPRLVRHATTSSLFTAIEHAR